MKFLIMFEGPSRLPTVTSVNTTLDVHHMTRVQCRYLILSFRGTFGSMLGADLDDGSSMFCRNHKIFVQRLRCDREVIFL